MKKAIIILACILVSGLGAFAQFGINTDDSDPDNSAMLDVKSSTKGALIPRMTYAERDAIVSPANGLMVFCTNCGTNGSLSIFANGQWLTFAPCDNQAPAEGIHVPENSSITWVWNSVPGASGYKWSETNDYATAMNMNLATSKNETGLTCGTLYTRYAWSYNSCGFSTPVTLIQSTLGSISTPVAGAHVPGLTSIIWNWNVVAGADGYKWNSTNNYGSAIDLGTNLTYNETGLTCGTPYTRYVWAYNTCGVSDPAVLNSSTSPAPVSPTQGVHVGACTSITWNWNTVPNATGYKWSATNNYATATDMGTNTSHLQSGLTYGTAYNSYAWAYNACGNSTPVTLSGSTSPGPPAPVAAAHDPSLTSIEWKWNMVDPEDHYKWNTVNNYSTATDLIHDTTYFETGLSCGTAYTRYIWAYNECGPSASVTLTQSTNTCPSCGDPITINHLASGGVAPVDKTVTYGTVTNVPGEATKCWITKNLGASVQASSATDNTEAAAGWYWQFNRMQGYMYESSRVPTAGWQSVISETSNWTSANDPCSHEIGLGFRLPLSSEWTNVDGAAGGNWSNYNHTFSSLLVIHAAGHLTASGTLEFRGSSGFYWSSTQLNATYGYSLNITVSASNVAASLKYTGNTVRCIQD